MTVEPGGLIRLLIEKIVYPGRRLARFEGRVVFTDEGLPGETVEAEITGLRTGFVEARTLSIVSPSASRVGARCNHYRACGPYQTMPYRDQIEVKQSQVAEILEASKTGIPIPPEIVPSPAAWEYRNRIRFAVTGRDGNAGLAYHAPGSREAFVPVEACFLASPGANTLAAAVPAVLGAEAAGGLSGVEVRESREEDGRILVLHWKAGAAGRRKAVDALIRELAGFPLLGIVSRMDRRGRTEEAVEWGRGTLLERIGDVVLEYGADSFFQVNISILPRLIDDMADLAALSGKESIADFYGGVGTFGLALSRRAGRVAVVESQPANVRFLKTNISRNRLVNAKVCDGSSEEWVWEVLRDGPDLVLLDPPRKGLAPEVVRALRERPPAKVLYLSCNPSTLVRDLAALRPGLDAATARLYDFFPQTPHVETLALLVRR